MGRIVFLAALALGALCACSEKDEPEEVYDAKRDVHLIKKGEEVGVGIDKDDAAMEKAMEKARSELPSFLERFSNPGAGQSRFAVKGKFVSKEGEVEYIWVALSKHVDGKFSGLTMNEPFFIKGMPAGSKVVLDKDDVCDWCYFDDGKMVGAYTQRVLEEKTK